MEKTESAVVKNSIPPIKDPAPKGPVDPSDKDKKEDTNKPEENPAEGAEGTEVAHIKSSKAAGRKKIELGGSSYYVVSLDEIDRYVELKDSYKTDAMSAFIVYLHKDFISDLKKIRRRHTIKTRVFLVLGIFTMIILGLVLVAVLKK